MGCDGNEHILVERELLLNLDKQRVGLVWVCVVYGRSGGHRERASRSEVRTNQRGDESAKLRLISSSTHTGFRVMPMMTWHRLDDVY